MRRRLGILAAMLVLCGGLWAEDGRAPAADLIAAAKAGDGERTARLLAAGADANAVDELGLSALNYAANSGSVPTVKALLAAGARPDYTDPWGMISLHAALKEGHDEVAALLVEAGSDVNVQVRSGYFPGFSPLHTAVYFGKARPATVRLLIERGADVKARDARGRTALDMARERGDGRVIGLLEVQGP